MKARKRKASPGIIDLTCPTQKRPRSASGNDVIVLDGDTGTSDLMIVGGESGPGRSPSAEIQDEGSLTKADAMKHVLNWSRLPMRQIRSALVAHWLSVSLTLFTGGGISTKFSISLLRPPSQMRRGHKERSLQVSNCDTNLSTYPGFSGRPHSCFALF